MHSSTCAKEVKYGTDSKTSLLFKSGKAAWERHLVRQGYKITVGQMYSTEIDFVATKGDNTIYVQASYIISEESTFQREFSNLQKINDNYPKYVVSMTPFMDSSKYEGIIHIPLRIFLRNGV